MNELERRFIAARRKAIELDYQRLNPMQREGVLTTELQTCCAMGGAATRRRSLFPSPRMRRRFLSSISRIPRRKCGP